MPTRIVASVALLALAPALLAVSRNGAVPDLPIVRANDNRAAAGQLRGNLLTVRLVVRMARWYPQSRSGPFVDVETFAEEGRAPMIPAPLIRVPANTVIEATIRNALPDSTVTIYGFHTRPAAMPDSFRLAPGEVRTVRFAAGAPGTYLYRGVVWKYRDRGGAATPEDHEREQLAGAFIVDSAGSPPDDRIFVINIWGDWTDSARYRNALAINGLSWPYTERLNAEVGDSLRWRVVNPTARSHPMHLHGFYYRVDSHGDVRRDTVYTPDQRRLVVTEVLQPGQTFAMTWSPDRPGNWLFHCHVGFHVVPEGRLDPPPHRHASHYAHDAGQHMAGLILGIVVNPGKHQEAERPAATQSLRIRIRESWKRGRAPRSMGFLLQRDTAVPAPDSLERHSSTLFLTRGEPTDITVVNELAEPTAVHWHGIELESYSDGVAGWSGIGKRVAPVIAPGDSFIARLTLARAGTFIYHTHLNDLEQLTSGLYGALVVTEPGRRFDPRTDHVFIVGWDGPEVPPHLVVNGDTAPPPVEMAFGITHRLRLINIGVSGTVRFAMLQDTTLTTWKVIAKDGADLPPSQARSGRATQIIMVGETYDFEFNPPAPGAYTLTVEGPRGPRGSKRRQRIEVR